MNEEQKNTFLFKTNFLSRQDLGILEFLRAFCLNQNSKNHFSEIMNERGYHIFLL